MNRIKKAAALVAAAGCLLYAQTPRWQNLYPSYSGLAFGDGSFVAVSRDGAIMASSGSDGGWTRQHFPHTGGLLGAAYGDGVFVVTQIDAKILLRSEDAANWGPFTTGTGIYDRCYYITFGGGSFVGVGDDAYTFLYDGDDDWNRYPSPPAVDGLVRAAYGTVGEANRYVAVGSHIQWSADARGWTQSAVSVPAGGIGAVAYGDGKFVAVAAAGSTVYTSENGQNWTSSQTNAPAGMADMTFGAGKFVAVGSAGRAAASGDGASWTASELDPDDSFRAVRHGNGIFMALGANGSVYTSADGETWTRRAGGRLMSYKHIVYGGTKFVAVGDSGVSVSGDGKDWVRKNAGKRLQSAAYGDGVFVAVGDSGAVFTSSDGGETWGERNRGNSVMLSSVTYGNGIFLAGGRSGTSETRVLLSSENGQDWSEIISVTGWGQQAPTVMAFGAGKFMSAGSGAGGSGGGTLRTSSDANGRYWSDVTLPQAASGYRIVSLAFVENKFVALGASNAGAVVLSSPDGLEWAVIPGAPASAKSATFAKGFYIIAADSGNVYASTDGALWSLQGKATSRNLQTVYYANNTLLAAGAGGAMLYSAEDPVSVRHNPRPSGQTPTQKRLGMTIERAKNAPAVKLSFTPEKPGTISVYSLNGKLLYKKRLSAGENTAQLPKRTAMNGTIIIKYAGDGMTVSERFQTVR
jgi:hypothetical protein